MEFSEGQLAEYEDRGAMFFPGLLHGDEVAALQAAMSAILSREGPEIIREKGGDGDALLLSGHNPGALFTQHVGQSTAHGS